LVLTFPILFIGLITCVEFFLSATPCSDVVAYKLFGGPCCLHLQHGPPKSLYATISLHDVNPKEFDLKIHLRKSLK